MLRRLTKKEKCLECPLGIDKNGLAFFIKNSYCTLKESFQKNIQQKKIKDKLSKLPKLP